MADRLPQVVLELGRADTGTRDARPSPGLVAVPDSFLAFHHTHPLSPETTEAVKRIFAVIEFEFARIRDELGSIWRESAAFSRVASGPASVSERLVCIASLGTPVGQCPWPVSAVPRGPFVPWRPPGAGESFLVPARNKE